MNLETYVGHQNNLFCQITEKNWQFCAIQGSFTCVLTPVRDFSDASA